MWQLGTKTVDKLGLPSLQNCAGCVVNHPVDPFVWAFDMLMLGSGVGYNIQKKYVYMLPEVKDKISIERKDSNDADYIVPDTREGWVKLLGRVLKAHFYSGKGFTYSMQLIRSKGAPIKGFGGVASGPEELYYGINQIHKILNSKSGEKLEPIDCLDIMNIIGQIVVSASVRRGAQIAIGDCDDIKFLKAKRWDLGNIPNWRAYSNNSVVCDNIEDLPEEYWETYKQGEAYGLINLNLSKKVGRLNDFKYPDKNIVVYNPCVTGDTEILTDTGYKRIDSLIGQSVNIWNGFEWSNVEPKITGQNQHILKITLSNGIELKCTDYHKFILWNDIGTSNFKKANELKIGDVLPVIDSQYSQVTQQIVKIEDNGYVDNVYCFNEPLKHYGIFNGILTGQCGEQPLNDKETCCLAEVFLPRIESKEELFKVVYTLYRICKHSLALKCHLEDTEKIVNSNMRMGISMTGILEASEEQINWLDDCYKQLRIADICYSKEKGFPESIKLTTVKPSGTLSLLANVTPGIHPSPAGPYYIRRIRIGSNSPLVDVIKSHGYKVEYQKNFDGSEDYNTIVAEFPCKVKDNTPVAGNISAIEHLELVKKIQTIWSDNSVSASIYYTLGELDNIKQWLKDNYKDSVKTVSFMLYSDHGFLQAPYETITKEKYEELIKNTTPITSLDSNIDESSISGLDECIGGMCPIK